MCVCRGGSVVPPYRGWCSAVSYVSPETNIKAERYLVEPDLISGEVRLPYMTRSAVEAHTGNVLQLAFVANRE